MAKRMYLSVRMEPEERAAIELAARDHKRKLSDLGRLCIVGWLQAHDYLQGETAFRSERSPKQPARKSKKGV